MKLVVFIIFFILVSADIRADVSLSGQWYCTVKLDNKKTSIIDFFTLEIDKSVTNFKKVIAVSLSARGTPLSSIQFNTLQEGTVEVDGNYIKLYPLKADLEIIKGKKAIKQEIRDELIHELFKDEIGVFHIENESSLIIGPENAHQMHNCIKRKDTIQ